MSILKDRWYVYLLECSDGTFYCGVTKDVKRRLREHNETKRGAKYTRSRRPVSLLEFKEFPSRSDAQKAEYFVKTLKRADKIKYFS